MRAKYMKALCFLVLVLGLFGMSHWTFAYPPDFSIPVGYRAERVLTPPLASPLAIAINSTGDIIVTDDRGQGVYQVHEDGIVTEYITPISSPHRAIAFDSTDNLYVSTGDGIWKVTPAKVATKLVDENFTGQMAVSPSGDIFTINGSQVHRITQAGQVSVYASGLDGIYDLAINPISSDLYVANWNEASILKVNSDGTTNPLATGLPDSQNFITFSSTGTLYYNNGGGEMGMMSTIDGSMTPFSWATSGQGYECGIHHGTIRIDDQDKIVAADSIRNHILRYDPVSETIDILIKGNTNSFSLAVSPNGSGTYLGVIHPLCNGKGQVQRINVDGTATVVVDDLPSSMNSIAFDSTGLGYAATGGKIYTFNTLTGTSMEIVGSIGPQNLAVNPQDDVLWGTDWDELWHLDAGNQPLEIGYPFTQTIGTPGLAFTPDGELYLYVCAQEGSNPPQPSIYHYAPDGAGFTLLRDMTEFSGGVCMGFLTSGMDGNLYWLLSDLVRITPAGEATILGAIPGYAQEAIAGDPNSTDLYYTSAQGVYRLFEVDIVYLPLVVRE